jgi:tetratricopeptide (TPR) repeat protein
MTFTCPVCETSNEDSQHCQQCSTDLGPLVRIAQLPRQYCHEGVRLLDGGDADSALGCLTVAASLAPESADAHAALSRAYAQKGMYDEALSHCALAQQLAPDRQDLTIAHQAVQDQRSKAIAVPPTPTRRWIRWVTPSVAFGLGIASLALVYAVNPPPPPPKPDLAVLVRQHLESHTETRGLNLAIIQEKGVVHISGHVTSEAQLLAVRESAAMSAGDKFDLGGLNATPRPPSAMYQVRDGDSLSAIAKRKYGNAALWREILRANPGHSENIRAGEQVTLPTVTLHPH